MEERYLATVDLGTSKIALSVAKVAGNSTEILYYSETPADGIRYGCIFNPTKAAAPLRKAVAEAENELGIKINQVVIGLPRYGVYQEQSSARIDRSDAESCINQEEIDAIKNMALDSYPLDNPEKQEIYGAAAQSFSTEDSINCTEDDIVGMPSAVLEGNFKVFVGERKASRNIDIMLNQAGIAAARKYFLPPVTADAVLKPEEKENGVALVEMGAGVSSVTIYQGGILRYYFALPFGGASVTNDIKMECGFGGRLAENIKLGFGSCMPDKLQTLNDKILQIRDEENGSVQQLPVKYLSEIITARTREIVDAILFKIQESGYADRLRRGVVVTGGGCELTGFCNLVKEMSGYNVRVGYPIISRISVSGCEGVGEVSAVSTIGMLMLAREDSHLNCIEEVSLPQKARPSEAAAEKAVAQDSVPDLAGTVFDNSPEAPVRTGTDKKTPAEKKPRRNPIVSWTKKTFKPVEDLVGNLYEKMEETEEN